MEKYRIIREDWFDHEDTVVGRYDSLEEAKKDLQKYQEVQANSTGPKDIYSLYEVPEDGHEPMSYEEWLMA